MRSIVRPTPAECHANRPQQLRLPLMRQIGATGLPLRNTPAVESMRLFLVGHSHLPAKLVAKATGSQHARVMNEDEGRVLFSLNTTVCRFRDLNEEDGAEFLEKLRAMRR